MLLSKNMQPLRHHLSLCARGCQLLIQLSALGGQLVCKGLPLLRAVHRAVEPPLPVRLARLRGRLCTWKGVSGLTLGALRLAQCMMLASSRQDIAVAWLQGLPRPLSVSNTFTGDCYLT